MVWFKGKSTGNHGFPLNQLKHYITHDKTQKCVYRALHLSLFFSVIFLSRFVSCGWKYWMCCRRCSSSAGCGQWEFPAASWDSVDSDCNLQPGIIYKISYIILHYSTLFYIILHSNSSLYSI